MKSHFLYLIVGCLTLLLTACTLKAQNSVAVKSNLFYDATTTLNGGVEFGLAPRWSLDVSGNLNPWTFDEGKRWKHWMAQPELRYWLCDRFIGHFFGLHALGGQYNFGNWDTDFEFLGTDFSKLKDYRYQGWYLGAGLAYGYSWVLGRHWNLEGELGLGYIYFNYDKFNCDGCVSKLEEDKSHNYFGPTKIAINLVYCF
jgi:hypothetical protein